MVRTKQRVLADTDHAATAMDASTRRHDLFSGCRGLGHLRGWTQNRTLVQKENLMSIHHAAPSEIIKLPLGAALSGSKTATVVKTANLELIRLVIHAGKEIPLHKASNEITVQCMEGRVAFTAEGTAHELTAGAVTLPCRRCSTFLDGH